MGPLTLFTRGGRRYDGGDEIVTHGVPEIDVSEDPEARAREADSRIARRLRKIDYDLIHPEAQLLADHLQSLGVGTLVSLKRSNELLNSCEKLIRRTLPAPPESWHNESQRLIIVSVRAATPGFITRSMRKWDPQGSAISTYFVNRCLFSFKKTYLEYRREEIQGCVEWPASDVIDRLESVAAEVSSDDLAIARQTTREVTKMMGSQEFATIVLLTVKGLTRKQIAEQLSISASSLDRHIAGYRRKLEAGDWSAPSEGMASSAMDNFILHRGDQTHEPVSTNTENFARMLERSSVGSGEARQARLEGSTALAEHSPVGSPWIDHTAFLPDIATLHLTIADLFEAESRSGPSELWLRAALHRTEDGPASTRLATLLEQQHRTKEAVVWYQRAAELGDFTATARLAVLCELKNCREIAEILLSLARSHMSPEQLFKADRLAATLRKTGRKSRAELISDYGDEDLLFWMGCVMLVSGRRDVASECYSAVAIPGHGNSLAALSLSDLQMVAVSGAGELGSTGGNDLAGLVSAAIDGTQASLADLLRRIRPAVLRYCRARIGGWGTTSVSAEDVAQEACLAVLTALPTYRDQGRPFLAFVYGIAAHKVADAHRAAGRNHAEPVTEVPDSIADPDDGPEQRAIRGELAARVNTLLGVLPDKQREVLILRIVVGLSAEETAEVVKSTPGAVRVAQHRALAKLREALPTSSQSIHWHSR